MQSTRLRVEAKVGRELECAEPGARPAKMKAIVQSKKNQLFLGKDQTWVAERTCALDFKSCMDAMEFCSANQIREVEIVLVEHPNLNARIDGP